MNRGEGGAVELNCTICMNMDPASKQQSVIIVAAVLLILAVLHCFLGVEVI